MLNYYKQEKLLNTLPVIGNETMNEFWKVSYLDRYARNESRRDREELLRTAKLQFSSRNTSIADIYRYQLAKKNLR